MQMWLIDLARGGAEADKCREIHGSAAGRQLGGKRVYLVTVLSI